ncbi:hypothetical protein Vdis_0158 [Vulcanisaeta distributa DSM 14429]|uniref:Uncharacterized protein n=1 Tax=Vulcanisaeta distributa (strain DSM 14429 / JCM 11212 / NBRC 100878 / IC-017) TaxID=572478 RepID=E1QSQ4_VULDI|nr:hypothetical protein Vdis_0158 [Vulcanisaeta distributa DSM 14429]
MSKIIYSNALISNVVDEESVRGLLRCIAWPQVN